MPGPLDGLLVLQIADGVAAGYCGRLFAGFGATVVVLEGARGSELRHMRVVPGGPLPDPEEAPAWLYLGAGKRSLGDVRWTLLEELAELADVLISGDPGFDADLAFSPSGRRIQLSLTAHGDWGPDARWAAENINALALGGQMWLTGEPDREPLCTAGEQAWMQLGLSAFAAGCFALLGVQATGLGQRIEVAASEVMAGATEGFGPNARFSGVAQGRSGRARFSMMGIYPCRDGYAGVYGTNRQLPLFSRIAGRPELASDPRFSSLAGMLQHNAELTEVVTGYVAAQTKTGVRAIGRETGMTMAPVASIAEVAASDHLAARGFFVEMATSRGGEVRLPGRPFNMSATPWAVLPAPALGELTTSEAKLIGAAAAVRPPEPDPPVNPHDRHAAGLLAGVRVLDLTAYWAGPYATKWLADFGAEVVKVESPALTDFIRSVTSDPEHERPYDYSAYFNNYSRGKQSLALDPANPAGRALFLELLPHFDVVIENFKAGRMVELGLGYEDLKAVKPDIILVSISGYGQDGPDSTLAGVGTNMEQLSGLASLNRYSNSDQPYNTGIAYGDPTSGTAGAAAVAMALLHRNRTGEGQYVEISGHETIASLIGEQFAALSLGLDPQPRGNRHPDMAPHGCYPCAGEDSWLTIAVRDDEGWEALCRLMDRPELAADYPTLAARTAAEDEIDASIISWTVLHEAAALTVVLQGQGIAAAPVLSTLDLPRDPHFRARGYYVTVDHPDQGAWPHDGIAWRMSRTPGSIRGPAPRFGEHTRAVLTRYLGKTDTEIEALYAAGAIADAPYRR